ncbi:MAG: UDP-glucose/GDP-mannose dehydrogenase family protein [archaeon]
MNITVIGTGYVGLVLGTCLANLGNDVINLDIDKKKIETLNNGNVPIYEPGLRELIEINVKEDRQKFTTDEKAAIQHGEVIFIAVGTPQGEDGQADLSYVLSAAGTIGKHMNKYTVIVDKSTVPVGTAEKVRETIRRSGANGHKFDLVSNPEFLREGEAVKDFMNPDRVVIGLDSERAKEAMFAIYRDIARTGKPILFTDIKSAELIKYASNAMLATRISFMNQLAPLCERIGADIKLVSQGMGLDSRIGPRFLQAGAGYGGSCFPKDVLALIHTLKEHGCESDLVESVHEVNERQKKTIVPKVKESVKDLSGANIAVWGLAFKPKTDDMREAPASIVINDLLAHGANITAFDPVAEGNARKIFPDINYAKKPLDAAKGADALIILTEWDEFRQLDHAELKDVMKQPIIIDGRNIYDPQEMKKAGFSYICVGRA